MLEDTSWKIIPILATFEFDPRLTPRAQTSSKLLYYDLLSIKSQMARRGGYWNSLKTYRNDPQGLQAQLELYQRTLTRITAQMEVLAQQLQGARDKELKVRLFTSVAGSWNAVMELLVAQYPNIKGCPQAQLCEKEGICTIEWIKP